jgi:hypothetical protein
LNKRSFALLAAAALVTLAAALRAPEPMLVEIEVA